jgi:hypothetical protein
MESYAFKAKEAARASPADRDGRVVVHEDNEWNIEVLARRNNGPSDKHSAPRDEVAVEVGDVSTAELIAQLQDLQS